LRAILSGQKTQSITTGTKSMAKYFNCILPYAYYLDIL